MRRAASTAPSACPQRGPCSPWRASQRMSPTGTLMRSSGHTARAGSPPGWSRPRSTASFTPARWCVLYAARHRVPVPSLARWLLGLGIAATLTANMAQGWSHGPVGAVVAAWPAVSLVGSYELLVWLIRTSGTVEHRPSAEHLCDAAPCRAAGRSATTAATATEFPRRGEPDTPDQTRQPAAQVAGPPAIPASGQRDQAVPEAGAVDDAAVAAYRLSAQAGNPLSERKLAQMFGRTSRRWARARIAEARRVPSSGLTEDPAITVGTQSR